MRTLTLEAVRSAALDLSDAEAAWQAEIGRRLAEIDAGTAELIDRKEFGRRLRARLSTG